MPESELNKIISEKIAYYLERTGKTQAGLADYMGVSQATVSNWCNGIKIPRMDKIDNICAFLGVKRFDIMNSDEKGKEDIQGYYINDDAREMAEFMFRNPEYKVLFDASRKVKKEDIEFVKQMIDRMRGDTYDDGC
ncbi:helix-turn-helix transcriptional regulator [Lachnospiraceae bacterium ZAX-1]